MILGSCRGCAAVSRKVCSVKRMKSYVASDIKSMNRRSVYDYISRRENQPVSSAEIAKATHISAPTVLKIVEFFTEKRLLTRRGQDEAVRNDVGRKPFLLSFNPSAAYAAGINYNGTVMEASLVNLHYMNTVTLKRAVKTDLHTFITCTIPEVIEELIGESGFDAAALLGIAIALPAAVDSRALSIISKIPDLTTDDRHPLSESIGMLASRCGTRVSIENDVNAAAYSSFRMNGLGISDDLAFLYIGSGCGAGIILNGVLRRGASNSCGEIGFMIFDRDFTTSRTSYGYFESLFSPEYILERFGIDIERIDSRCDVSQLVEHAASHVAMAVANLTAALDITRFTLGGRLLGLLEPAIMPRIAYYCSKFCLNPPALSYEAGEFIVVNGAASLIIDSTLSEFLS
jgi:predicted NBD/HSP70 family sugar kinase